MTVFEAFTLEDIFTCYDKETYTINADEVNRLLNNVRVKQSYNLYTFLQKIILQDEVSILTIEELIVELNQYKIQSQKKQLPPYNGNACFTQNAVISESQNIQEETILRSAPIFVQENTFSLYDDLNARIEACLKLTGQTLVEYGSSTQTNPLRVTQVDEIKATPQEASKAETDEIPITITVKPVILIHSLNSCCINFTPYQEINTYT